MTRAFTRRVAAFASECRAAAALELGVGGVSLLAVSLLCFDFYSRVQVDAASASAAVTMGEYVSREAQPVGSGEDEDAPVLDAGELAALGEFLQRYGLGAPASVAYVVSAVQKPSVSDPAEVVWVDTFTFGDAGQTLANACGQFGTEGGPAQLPGGFTLLSDEDHDEVLIVAEVCARPSRQGLFSSWLFAGDVYSVHALVWRGSGLGQVPAGPVHAVAPDEPDEPESDPEVDAV